MKTMTHFQSTIF